MRFVLTLRKTAIVVAGQNTALSTKHQTGREVAGAEQRPVYCAVPDSANTVVVSDAHLGRKPGEVTETFHRFLETVPHLGDHLLINGDLFEFWFAYRSVIPRAGFQTLAALARVRGAGVRLTVTGGNHDRWGADFWKRELDAAFHMGTAELDIGGRRAWVAHGDDSALEDPAGRLMRAVTGHRLTARAFHWLHPDLAFWLIGRVSARLATRKYDDDIIRRSAAAQARYAHWLLAERPELDLVILGHTHAPTLEVHGEGRWYLNPGAWMDGYRYALISSAGPELRCFR